MTTVDMPCQHPDLIKAVPALIPLEGSPGRTEYDLMNSCDVAAFAQNQAAMNAIASNLDAYDAVVNLIGIRPWAEQVHIVRQPLDAILGKRHEKD